MIINSITYKDGKPMDGYNPINRQLVNLLHEIMDFEQKAIIVEEFKDISSNDLQIIEAIGVGTPKNMSTTAKMLKVTVGTLTIAINSLVKKGYVKRVRGEEDRRVVFISLSDKGTSAYQHQKEFHETMSREMVSKLDEEELKVLMRGLESLREYFRS